LFEVITGKRAFHGKTASDTIAAVLDHEPAWDAFPAATPVRVTNLIRHCLQRDLAQRAQTIAEVAGEIATIRVATKPRKLSRLFVAQTALLIVAAGIAALPPVRHRILDLFSSPVVAEKHLAILPFMNIGNDPSNQIFCDGLIESLTSDLTQMERFHQALLVVPSAEVRRQAVTSPSDARRSFGVGLAITGSVQRAGDEVRVTVNLVDTHTMRQLGSRGFVLKRDDLSEMEDRLPRLVADLLDVQLPSQARSALDAGTTKVSGAYDAYLLGRGYLRRYDKEGNLELAISAFKVALQKDSRYALAYAGLGEAYWRTFDRTKNPDWLELAREANTSAIELSSGLASAHVNLGMTFASSGRYEVAVTEFQRALDIDPSDADAYRELASAYESMNRIADAETTFKRAIQIRPNDWLSNSQLGVFYYRRGRYADSEPLFRKVISLTPDNVNGYSNLGALYVAWGRYDQAEKLLRKAIQVKPSDPRGYSNLGTLYFQTGRQAGDRTCGTTAID